MSDELKIPSSAEGEATPSATQISLKIGSMHQYKNSKQKFVHKKKQNKREEESFDSSEFEVAVYTDNSEANPLARTYYAQELKQKGTDDLMELVEEFGVENADFLTKSGLIFALLKRMINAGHRVVGEGVLEILSEGFGFLRSHYSSYAPGNDDLYISRAHIKRYKLRTGDTITCTIKIPYNESAKEERYLSVGEVLRINGDDSATMLRRHRPHFDDLTPLHPNKRLHLELPGIKSNISNRLIDIISPQGKGQRTLIVAPPRGGKTFFLQEIAEAVAANHPESHLFVLLIDERPEEVTHMRRAVKGEVISSTFDEPSTRHVQVAEMVFEKARRLVEMRKDVVILLDSLTRLARAYNNVAPSSGKVLSGGVDSNALQKPKRLFGAARNVEEGGSLTVIATALVDTNSRMDEVIFEEFKGTGNSEIVFDRRVAEKRIFPALDISKSGTRQEGLLIPPDQLNKIWILRRLVNSMTPVEAVEFLIDKVKNTANNAVFFEQMSTYNTNKKNNNSSSGA